MRAVSRPGRALGLVGLVLTLLSAGARAEEPRGHIVTEADGEVRLTLFVDRDDDDADGVPDYQAAKLSPRTSGDVQWIEPKGRLRPIERVEGSAVRLVFGDEPVAAGKARGRRAVRFGVQGVQPGRSRIFLQGLVVNVLVLDIAAVDENGERVDLSRSHASITRTLPAGLESDGSESGDRDALSWVVGGEPGSLPRWLGISSFGADDKPLDTLGDVVLSSTPCPSDFAPELQCAATPLIRATSDLVDRSHPDSVANSLLAEVGGKLVVGTEHALAALRVGGPRHSALGPIERFRGKLRVRLVRLAPKGSPPVGGNDAGALAIGAEEVRTASALWGQCGIHFGLPNELDIQVVDPPSPHLIAVGCDLGTPASGGELAFVVDKRKVVVPTHAGQTPTEVARAVVGAVKQAGYTATLSPNAPIGPAALRTADVLVKRNDGAFAPLAPVEGHALASDATLGACLGEVDLADGLSHFSDFDAPSGTVEERSLIKAFDDGDPSTIEVFVIPSFARTGRIGESFIYADGSSIRNAVIVDRAGIRAGARSFALAHELGHILLDMPGHPDDYGVDRPSMLMDADAADPTIFGPRRLSVAECERALRQSGPDAPVPLLTPWPLIRARSR
jgi:hypothetical protein